ncbi:SAM-dependent methyltransferase [Streptacidiphilus carbonis]|uniref:SAM-dependent methyltransferase n=1 Tax=Streptacidiphilus carbonis TaxID=105422 RepID=UPI0005A86EA9|nr:SAM-dependent methyltransferase [Streptacidiphilus carbonis]
MTAENWDWAVSDGSLPASVDLRTDIPHPARMYDYYLGGKDNFPADRAAAAQVVQLLPSAPAGSRANRRFLGRAVRYAAELGIRQFLDIGTGIPASNNTHEVAQAASPDARVVYVDNDPIVLTHARALLRGTAEGRTAYIDADFRDPDSILQAAQTKELLDFTQPVALLVVALLHFFSDTDNPQALLARYVEALPPGSLLILTHGTGELMDPEIAARIEDTYTKSGLNIRSRTHVQVLEFFKGLELVEPGLVPVHEWRPDPDNEDDRLMTREEVAGYGGVALKRG